MKIILNNYRIFAGDQSMVLNEKLTLAHGLSGTGKTILSSFMYHKHVKDSYASNEGVFSRCKTEGFEGKRVLVFNRDFIKDNFCAASMQRGIFSLSSRKVFEKMDALKSEKQKCEFAHRRAEEDLSHLQCREKTLNDEFAHDLSRTLGLSTINPLSRYMGIRGKFLEKFEDTPKPAAKPGYTWRDLRQEANDLRRARRELIMRAQFSFNLINIIEEHPIWRKTIKGKGSSSLAAQYKEDTKMLATLAEEYVRAKSAFADHILRDQRGIKQESTAKKARATRDNARKILSIMDGNLNAMKEKLDSPSMKASVAPTKEAQERYHAASSTLNSLIASSREAAEAELIEKIWLLAKWDFENRDPFKYTIGDVRMVQRQMAAANEAMAKAVSRIAEIDKKIGALQKPQERGIGRSAKKINEDLKDEDKDLDITNFYMEVRGGHYQIRRPGQHPGEIFGSLSESEKNFISFLYFLELCAGVNKPGEDNREGGQAIIIDDPVANLSHQYMSKVSQLIPRRLVRRGNNKVLVLTHNLCFFRKLENQMKGKDIAKYRFVKKTPWRHNLLTHIEEGDPEGQPSSCCGCCGGAA